MKTQRTLPGPMQARLLGGKPLFEWLVTEAPANMPEDEKRRHPVFGIVAALVISLALWALIAILFGLA